MITNRRTLGRSGIEIAPLAFGGNVFGWTADEKTSFALLDHFTANGFNLVDTADIYSTWIDKPGISETIIGKWLRQSGKRADVVIATKVGMEFAPGKSGLSRAHIVASVEDSLRRLQTDYIDLYQAHADDPDTPPEETLAAFSELVESGKVRAIGASNFSAERLRESLAISEKNNLPRYETLQPEYNLYDRAGFEKDLQAVCTEKNISAITYFSLASGFLAGKYRTEADLAGRPRADFVKKYMDERGQRILRALDQVAELHESTVARVAIAWILTRHGVAAPIASATSIPQLDDLIAAVSLQIDQNSIETLDAASAVALGE